MAVCLGFMSGEALNTAGNFSDTKGTWTDNTNYRLCLTGFCLFSSNGIISMSGMKHWPKLPAVVETVLLTEPNSGISAPNNYLFMKTLASFIKTTTQGV